MKILDVLNDSRATDRFREALLAYLQTGETSEPLRVGLGAPPVKVARTMTKLLEEFPEAEIDSVLIDASSGCEYFRGHLVFGTTEGEERRVRFHWDCKWKAEQLGWRDYFGFPDQARAAREFGHDCFRSWEPEGAAETV